ncbi:hypothetical protein COZ14_02675, partial [Candidatus Dojkabacteria bacterium CG_4_10_14_3_um_filter_Dojkabacteria_WS6_41_9]
SPDVIINMVETVDGDTLKASSAYETIATLRIPYTGVDAKTFVLNCYKDAFKECLLENHVSTPAYAIIDSLNNIDSEQITPLLPAMVKLNTHMGGSIGMDETAICYTLEQVRTRCETIMKTFKSKALVEKYIKGKELTGIAIQRDNDIDVFVGQKIFSADYSFCSWKAVWIDEDSYAYNGPYDDSDGKIRELCIGGFRACGVTGYAKFDILVDQDGTPYIVDINPNCSLGQYDSAIDVVPSLFGRKFEVSLFAIINTALKVNKQRALEVAPQKALYFHT